MKRLFQYAAIMRSNYNDRDDEEVLALGTVEATNKGEARKPVLDKLIMMYPLDSGWAIQQMTIREISAEAQAWFTGRMTEAHRS